MGFSVYAGREIAVFRNRPIGLVCGLSALFPVIAPTVFLLLPDPAAKHAEAMAEAYDPHLLPAEGGPLPLPETMAPTGEQTPASTPVYEDDPDSPYLNMDLEQEETHYETTSGPAEPAINVYRSTDYQIDFHFFNDYFQPFVGNSPPAGRSLIIRTSEVEYPAYSISRINPDSLNVFYASGNEWVEETIFFAHIDEVEVRLV